MGIWSKIAGAFRRGAKPVLDEPMTTPVDPRRMPYISVPSRQAGVFVDQETAMTFGAVFRAVSYIAQSVASLPWVVIKENDRETTKARNHPVWKLIQTQANPEMTNYTWEETMVAWACTWGNAYSEIEFNKGGQPIGLWPIEPYRVRVTRATDPKTGSFLTGPLVYKVSNEVGGQVTIPAENMFHLKGLGFNGLVGYSVIGMAARSIGLGIAAEQFGEDLFANGSFSTGAITHPSKLTKETKEDIRQALEGVTKGYGRRFHVPIFDQGIGWQNLMINPEDAQLLLTRKFQVTEIARWFGLPPHKLMDLERSTFSNIEAQNIEVVQDALRPWIIRLEQEADMKLLQGRRAGIRTKIELRSFLRGDHQTRASYYQTMRNIAGMTPNEVRRLEDLNPVGPEGDVLTMQSGFVTLKTIAAGDSPTEEQGKDGKKSPASPAAPFPAKKASLGYFREAENRIFKRAAGQFNQMRPKLDNDPGAFDAWANIFFQKNRTYIAEQLAPLAWNFASLVRADISRDDPQASGIIGTALNAFIDQHTEFAREHITMAFHGDHDAETSSSVSGRAVQILIDRLVDLISRLPDKPHNAAVYPKAAKPVSLPKPTGWSEIGEDPDD